MARARKTIIELDATSYYHIYVRAVRRCFLCGDDKASGRNYDHRKQWLESELLRLSAIFAIDVSAYAIMSNHYHVILHVNKARTAHWDADEIITRWHKLFKGTAQSQAFLRGETLKAGERSLLDSQVQTWQQRLTDISWFMRVINEKIARKANAEDECTGRFWEGRFNSQALLDEKALLACMAYIDLNPIRAKVAKTPETSEHTSIKRRIDAFLSGGKQTLQPSQPDQLEPFIGNAGTETSSGIPFSLPDYLELVDWTGRQIKQNKRGKIDCQLPMLLNRLAIEPHNWIFLAENYQSSFKSMVGSVQRLRATCAQLGWAKSHSLSMCRVLFG